MSYLLKFEYSNNYINDQLLPWKNQLNKEKSISSDHIEEYFQIGTAIKYSNNNIKIITPFFIHIPYSKCSILNTEITLQLVNYCYFTKIAVYTTNIKNISKSIKFDSIDTTLRNLTNNNIKQLDNSLIKLSSIITHFENMINDNIYPFVWLKSSIIDCSMIDDLIAGLPIYSGNKFIGILYNIINDQIIIIPNINIKLNLINYKLSNIFIDTDIDNHNQTIIKQSYNSYLKIGDTICSIDDQIINNQSMIFYDKLTIYLNNQSMIYYNELKIYIPINTYIWYQSTKSNIFKFKIIRDDKILNLNINNKRLDKQISFTINDTTEYKIINNIIIAKINLLMVEWLVENNIIFKSNLYLSYNINPFYYQKNNYIMIGIIDIEYHPNQINDIMSPYMKEIYSIDKYMQAMTILSINDKKIFNLNKINTISKMILSDSNEKEIILDWCC
jgi:hypothetical protein